MFRRRSEHWMNLLAVVAIIILVAGGGIVAFCHLTTNAAVEDAVAEDAAVVDTSKDFAEKSSDTSVDVRVYYASSNDRYPGAYYRFVVVDKTGVVYLQYAHDEGVAICPLMNPDGTPVTQEQLGLES